MTRRTAASRSAVLLLLLSSLARAEERPSLVLPSTPPPLVDGKVDDAAWEKAQTFQLVRGKDAHGDAWIARDGRVLYLALRTKFLPLTLGARFHFTDPATRRRVAVLVSPFDLPRSPLSVWLERSGGAEPLDAATCDVRFHSDDEKGEFSFEARLPLDTLEIGKPAKEFRFDAELWDTKAGRPIAYFPIVQTEAGAAKGIALLEGAPDWGQGVEDEAPPRQEAIALLLRLSRRSEEREGADEIQSLLGVRDGRRNAEPLVELEPKLEALIERYPDYASLRAQLTRVLAGLNRPGDAFANLESMRKAYPFLALDPRHLLAESQLLRDAGRFDEALARLEENRKPLEDTQDLVRDLTMLRSLKEAWAAEQTYRAEEAKRDDLPRVSVETSRGTFVLELFEDDAPNAVANFLTLVESKFYDGTRFHWVQSNGGVYGGDPDSRDQDTFNDGYGGPGYLIEPEPSRRVNLPMTVAMADLRSRPQSPGSSFVINLTSAPSNDVKLTVFARVIEGVDVVRKINHYDRLVTAKVVRKRDHEYAVVKRR